MNIQQQVDQNKQRDQWLASLDVDSEVAIKGSGLPGTWGYNPPRIGRVTRTTKTQMIVTFYDQSHVSNRYRRDTGQLIGGSWIDKLIEPTQQIREQIEHTNNLSRLARIAREPKKLTPAQVAAMLAAHDKHAPKE